MFIGRHRSRRRGDIRWSTAIVRQASVPSGRCGTQMRGVAESLYYSQSETRETTPYVDQVQGTYGAYR